MIKFQLKSFAVITLSVALFYSCNKNISSKNTEQSSSELKQEADGTSGRLKLTLQPGFNMGRNAYVYDLTSDPNSVNGNNNNVAELPVGAWTNQSAPEFKRFFIRFDSIAKIPQTATVVSATLQLFGLPGISLSTPQGNSLYPGSPYSSYTDNSALVQRVSATWDPATLTWANQPGVYTTGSDVIPSSTDQWNYNPAFNVTNLVKRMVTNPSTNYGFRISLSNENAYRSMVFASSKTSTASARPKLVIVYKL